MSRRNNGKTTYLCCLKRRDILRGATGLKGYRVRNAVIEAYTRRSAKSVPVRNEIDLTRFAATLNWGRRLQREAKGTYTSQSMSQTYKRGEYTYLLR